MPQIPGSDLSISVIQHIHDIPLVRFRTLIVAMSISLGKFVETLTNWISAFPPSLLTTGPLSVVISMAPPSQNTRHWCGMIRERSLDKPLIFLVSELLHMFGASPLTNFTTSLAAAGTRTPDHGEIGAIVIKTSTNIDLPHFHLFTSICLILSHFISTDFLLGIKLKDGTSLDKHTITSSGKITNNGTSCNPMNEGMGRHKIPE